MSEHDSLHQDLIFLGEELRRTPSIAPAVCQAVLSDQIEPSSPGGLGGLPNRGEVNRKTLNRPVRRFRYRLRQKVLAPLAVVVACTVFAMIFLKSDRIAFAQVKQRLASVRTASFTLKQTAVKSRTDGTPTIVTRRVILRGDGRIRMDDPDGNVMIVSQDDFVKLEINPKNRTATLRYLYEIEQQTDILKTLRSLHESINAIKLPPKQIGGVECEGFRIEERQSTLRVWIDPKTHLPVLVDRVYSEADKDVGNFKITYDDMHFDIPVSDMMFSIVPPADFVVTTVGTPPADRKEPFAEPLVVTPNVGVGPLKFGMLRAEIVRLLGKPDSETVSLPMVPITDKTSEIDEVPRPRGATLVVLTELHILKYNGLGMLLTVEATEGLRGIHCFGQDSLGAEVRTFRGATAEGIRIGSSIEDILKAYGKPNETPLKSVGHEMTYDRSHLKFALTEHRRVRSISLSDSWEHRLRFEWRVPEK